ncbi:MAG: histidinol-phosphatase HisJ family protein [Candidatus Lernaella stagnicola]|nr:histidinol-phosphatase HisJ family protein [Candidatus Lernaella stagnicola]
MPGADYHVHSSLCGHARGKIDAYVEHAIRVGLDEIGFSEHLPMDVWGERDPSLTMGLGDMDTYLAEVARVRDKYADRIIVRLGIEADFPPDRQDAVAGFLSRHKFDYVIGSVHFLGDWGIDDPRELHKWDGRDVDEVYESYFEAVRRAVQSGLFDILGHADLVKKFGHRPRGDISPWYERIAEALAAREMAVELNTAGLRKPVGEMYPHPDLLRACRVRDVPLVISSDAHAPEEVGLQRADAEHLAREIGFTHTVGYAARRVVTSFAL